AVSRLDVLVDAPTLGSVVLVEDDVLPVGARGVPLSLSVVEVLSLLVVLLPVFGFVAVVLLLERSVPVCAIAAGAARAIARTAVETSFIGYPPLSGLALCGHSGDDSPEGQRTTLRSVCTAPGQASAEANEGGELKALLPRKTPGAVRQAEKLEPQPQVCFAFGFLNEK